MFLRERALEIGDVVYAYDGASDAILIGNAEDTDQESILVSFARPMRARRAPPTRYSADDLILPDELGGAPEQPGFRRGELVMAPGTPPHAVPYAIEIDSDETSPQLSVRRLRWRAEDGWKADDALESVETSDIFRPVTLALISRWRYARPVDPLVDVIIDDVGEEIGWSDKAYLTIDGIDVPVQAHLNMSDHRVDLRLGAHYQIAGLVADVTPDKLVDEGVRPASGVALRWDAKVAVSGASLNWNEVTGDAARIDVKVTRMEVVHDDAPVIATRDVYIGAPIGAWSHQFFEREPMLHPLLLHRGQPPSTLQLETFGTRTIIYRPPQHAPEENAYTAIFRIGEPLDGGRSSVLSAFLGYITGGRCAKVLTETYAIDHKLSTEYVDRGTATKRRQYPIPLESPSDYTWHIVERLPVLLDAFERWRAADRRAFEAVLHHYGEGVDSNYPTTRILRLAVAFEAFVNLVTGDTAPNENISDHDDFVGLRNELRRTLKDFADSHPQQIDAGKACRYKTKIDSVNQASNTRRITRFWEIVPISRSAADDTLLRRLRNESVHLGYVGEESTSDGLRRNAQDADRLVDILNRAILAHAGYTGPVLRAREPRWLDAISGLPYVLPQLPPREHLPIEITTTVSAMTSEEAAAAVRLAAIGRAAQRDSVPQAQSNQV